MKTSILRMRLLIGNRMIVLLYVLTAAFTACTPPGKDAVNTDDAGATIDPVSIGSTSERAHVFQDVVDSLSALRIDTSNHEGKRQYIMNQFLIAWSGLSPEYDTLLDLNYDGIDDYAIGWYGMAGTGLKHNWDVFIWDVASNTYRRDSVLTGLSNPSFFSKDSMVTSFYLPYGSGHGERLEWLDGRWQRTMQFLVDNEEEQSDWVLSYPLAKRKKVIRHPYQGVPPQRILRHLYGGDPFDL
jgi:hypothetical protein